VTLSEFILSNMERLLQEWETFAATLVPEAQRGDAAMLRDHGQLMLEAIAADLTRPESADEQAEKSKGHEAAAATDTAATAHGVDRQAWGFTLTATVAEYRALRASVIRLWQEGLGDNPPPPRTVEDLIRFNEAIDQAVTESVTSYSFEKEQNTRVFNTILSTSPDLICIVDLKTHLAYSNRALLEFFNLTLEQTVGKTLAALRGADTEELQQHLTQVLNTREPAQGELAATSSTAGFRVFDYIMVPVLNETGAIEAVTITFRDMTERKNLSDKHWHGANYDELTGLPNRRLLLDRLDQDLKHAVRIGTRLALLFVDLDHFKEANDRFGHEAGDCLLREAAQRIQRCVRGTDTVARLGGDEFTVLLQDLTHACHAELVAGKIVQELASPFKLANATISLSASVGICLSSLPPPTPETLLKNADLAMYAAKSAGRNRVVLFAAAPRLAGGADLGVGAAEDSSEKKA
jgi:diguanylate cyclase (GGDEF)-like protein/PAS domain S-box-containing protein